MSRAPSDIPERLLGGDATDFERRVIDSARGKGPSTAASARMAKALGVSVISVGTAVASSAVAGKVTASGAAAATGSSSMWAWVSVGLVGMAVAGGVGGVRAWHRAHREPTPVVASPPVSTATAPAAAAATSPVPPAAVLEPTLGPTPAPRRARGATPSGDLREEIELVDSARRAVSAHAGAQALEILRRYQGRYPSGSFRPEATAIKIEALMTLGRDVEARSLAKQFVAEHRGSLLATRVAALVGLADPPAAP
jgi:hypothetical protein